MSVFLMVDEEMKGALSVFYITPFMTIDENGSVKRRRYSSY